MNKSLHFWLFLLFQFYLRWNVPDGDERTAKKKPALRSNKWWPDGVDLQRMASFTVPKNPDKVCAHWRIASAKLQYRSFNMLVGSFICWNAENAAPVLLHIRREESERKKTHKRKNRMMHIGALWSSLLLCRAIAHTQIQWRWASLRNVH